MLEATRCLNCKNPRCVQACPVGVNIPSFIAKVKDGDIEAAAQIIAQNSSLPAVCGRVCPQESQCEGSCVVGIKNEAVSIGKLEKFFRLEGPQELLQIALDCGLGAKNSAGWGCVTRE